MVAGNLPVKRKGDKNGAGFPLSVQFPGGVPEQTDLQGTWSGTSKSTDIEEYLSVIFGKRKGGVKDQRRTRRIIGKNRSGTLRVLRMDSGRSRFWNT